MVYIERGVSGRLTGLVALILFTRLSFLGWVCLVRVAWSRLLSWKLLGQVCCGWIAGLSGLSSLG